MVFLKPQFRPHLAGRQIERFLYSSSSRRINIPPPFPVTQTCPEPTCSCAETPAGLDIDHAQNLNGTMAPYSQQVLISTGQGDWRSRIEEDGHGEGWGEFVRKLKGLVGRGGKYSDPYNNIMITNSSFPKSRTSSPQAQSASAFLFPSFRYLPEVPLDEEGLDRFVRAFLLPRHTHKAHEALPENKRAAMTRIPELQSTFPNVTSIRHSPTILICSHGHRDQRCGIMGPLLQAEFQRVLRSKGFSVGSDMVDGQDHSNVGLISHIGGHKYAGNVIVYLPSSRNYGTGEGSLGTLAGKGIWYGRVEPKHVEGIVEETILKGKVIFDHFRGGVGEDGEVLRL